MAVTLNASTTAGLIQTADTTGNLSLQSNGTTIAALTSTGLAVTGAGSFSTTLNVTGVATLGNGAVLGTPASGTVTNLTGTASININGTVGATTATTGAFTSGTFSTTLGVTGAITASSTVKLGSGTNTYSFPVFIGNVTDAAVAVSNGTVTTGLWATHPVNTGAVGTRSNHSFALIANDVVGLTLTPSGNAVTIPGTLDVTGHATVGAGKNFQVGSASVAGGDRATTDPTNAVTLRSGTAPVGLSSSSACTFYNTSGEMRVMDGAGNATLLSPHAKDGSWIYDSVSPITGKHLQIDMEKMMKAINEKFGWDFVHEFAI